MSNFSDLSEDDRQRWLGVIADAGAIRTHRGLHAWLTGEGVQRLLPHRAMVAAWGDLHGGAIRYDIVSSVESVRTSTVDPVVVETRMRQLFARWSASTFQACVFHCDMLSGIAPALPAQGGFVLVHTRRDLRTSQYCCYALLCEAGADEHSAGKALSALLPYIDMAFGQVHPLPTSALPSHITLPLRASARRQATASDQINAPGMLNATMSDRELEIMRWVEMGKTNQEIGTILDISAFTVKNHLQRIFKKLDVYSRAQAVSRIKDSMFYG